jgi:hypothetical protein
MIAYNPSTGWLMPLLTKQRTRFQKSFKWRRQLRVFLNKEQKDFMTQGDIRIAALELWNVLKKPSCPDQQCIEMIENAIRNTAKLLAGEEHKRRLAAESERDELRKRLDMAPVAMLVHPVAELVL